MRFSGQLRMFYFIFAMFVVCDLLWWAWSDRRLRALPAAWLWRGLDAAFCLTMAAYVVLMAFFARPLRSSSTFIPVRLHVAIYLWHFMVAPVVILAWGGAKGLRRWRQSRKPTSAPAELRETAVRPAQTPASVVEPASPMLPATAPFGEAAPRVIRPTRRQVVAAAAMALPPLFTGVAAEASVRTMYSRRIRAFKLFIPHLPAALDGMTIAHVSDTHIGKFLRPARLPAIADDINRLDADFVAFTGDLIDLAMEDLPFGIDFLHRLRSRCGLIVCEGNHDIMQSRSGFEDAMRSDFTTLLGDQTVIPFVSRDGRHYPIQWLGVPWNFTDQEMAGAVAFMKPQIDPQAFPILLAHHPHSFDAAAAAGLPLVLSGHTHGGQIMLTSQIGAGALRFRYTSGLYRKGASNLIVNNGIGNWFPLRINAPAELIHITLKSA